jgi:DNA (cytosine-5)-methyltransferase 1
MKTVDLFCGCGGLSLGFERAGFEIVAAFDNWDRAISVYRENFSHTISKQDLSNVPSSVARIRQSTPDIIVGGPPCQDFSHAGNRSEGDRANLTIAFAEIVTDVKPQWFVMENVDRAQSSSAFKEAQAIFRTAGYGLTTVVLNASLCGVPQKRKRLVCFGKMGEIDGFLLAVVNSRLARKPMTVRDYLGDKLDTDFYYRHPRNYSRRGIYSVDEPAATVRGVNRPIPSGYKKHPGDPVTPGHARPLTTEERAVIQTFPRKYKWLGGKTEKEQMIGNAVPVKLAEFIGRCVLDYQSGKICTGEALRLPLHVSHGETRDGVGKI